MINLNPSMRLKVKKDTFFFPNPNGGVYFRNNLSSFHVEGKTIYQWIEKLIPMFNGEHTLEELTDGLPALYQEQVYKIADMLYKNGFVRDISHDRPHQLPENVVKKYDSQIEFLDHLSDSGAYRFQSYRQAKVVAIGSGPFFVSLVSALLESGLPKFHVLVTNSVPTNQKRLEELEVYARKSDPEVAISRVTLQTGEGSSWREAIQPFDWILYVSEAGDTKELQELHAVCRQEKKILFPALVLQQAGVAGPLVHPESEGCFVSAWRRLHRSALSKDPKLHTFSATAGALLANVAVFELFKTVTGVAKTKIQTSQFFLLDLETLEGNWHSFVPHSLVTGGMKAEWVRDLELLFQQDSSKGELSELLPYFDRLTSAESGIFHLWEEGDLNQLPLAQCRVVAADPLSGGPAELLPELICTGLTHVEARREAGLSGIEAYLSRMIDVLAKDIPFNQEMAISLETFAGYIGIGVGETAVEGLSRGLQKCLTEELRKQCKKEMTPVYQIKVNAVEDETCRFYLKALTTLQGVPIVGIGEEVCGFPVVWVGTGDHWYGSVGFNLTIAAQTALQQALSKAQTKAESLLSHTVAVSSVSLGDKELQSFVIPTSAEMTQSDMLQSAFTVLKKNHKQVFAFELTPEPALKERLSGMFGVLLREEGCSER